MKKISIEYFIVISEIITDTDVDHVMETTSIFVGEIEYNSFY